MSFVRALACLLPGFLVTCGGFTPAPSPSTPKVRLLVEAEPQANQGRSLRFLVREIDGSTAFLADDYATLVQLATHPDDSVLADRFLRPGTHIELEVTPAAQKQVGVYFFFTTPHPTKWKVRTSEAPSTVRILVGESAAEVR